MHCTIFTDLNSRRDTIRKLIVTTEPVEPDKIPDSIDVDLENHEEFYLAYDSEGLPLGQFGTADFAQGKAESSYIAHIKTIPTPSPPAASGAPATVKELTRIEVSIEAPGSAAQDSRTKYPFIFLLRPGIKK